MLEKEGAGRRKVIVAIEGLEWDFRGGESSVGWHWREAAKER